MNERIQELKQRAGVDRNPDQDGLDQFAELIVRDCALTAGLMEHEGRPGIGAQILDNFGVE